MGRSVTILNFQFSIVTRVLALAALIAVVGADALTAAESPLKPDKTWVEVQRRGALYFGLDAGFMPFAGIDAEGKFTGIDAEIARELARRLGLRVEFVQIGADRLYETLDAGQCDALISALTPEATRFKDFRYTSRYFDAGIVLVAPAASPVEDVRGKTLSVEIGSEGDARARWLARRTPGLRVIEYDMPDKALRAVETGLADAALTDTAMARQYVARHPALSIGRRQTSRDYVLAVRADSRQLLRALDRALAQLRADGTLDRVLARWLDQ
jgi:ABC-type amino acid transport substrate-binding protein